MQEIKDRQLLEAYRESLQRSAGFSTEALPFRLFEYAPGEMMNLLRPNDAAFKFVMDGVYDLYVLMPDGNRHMIHRCTGLNLLGYFEFSGALKEDNCQEVVETVRALELPMDFVREVLGQDAAFLRYLIRYMGFILSFSLPLHPEFDSLKDALLYHINRANPQREIRSVEETTVQLNCSRRQLQRVLKELTNQGVLEKTGRGCYRLV